MKNVFLAISIASTFSLSCSNDDDNVVTIQTPETVTISKTDLFPEGITYDKNRKNFIVSSTSFNTTDIISDNGVTTVLSTDPQMPSAYGLKADVKRNQLYVAGNGVGTDNAQFGIYDLTTGAIKFSINLDAVTQNPNGRHTANDVCYDKNGNMYITDSFSPIIYKVTQSGVATVFLTHSALNPSDPSGASFSFGLNGIEYVENGNYLLVSNFDFGTIHKIPVDNPSSFNPTPVYDTNENFDGIIMLPNGKLAVVSNGTEPANCLILNSNDNFTTASLEKTIPLRTGVATTLTLRDSDLYAIYSKLGSSTSQNTFEIGKINYK